MTVKVELKERRCMQYYFLLIEQLRKPRYAQMDESKEQISEVESYVKWCDLLTDTASMTNGLDQ
jgi:hypothetical protein